MNEYLIPANSKKSQLILGFFTPLDLIIFGSGAFTTFMLLSIFSNPGVVEIILMLLPLLITAFLVMPVLHYHNVLQFLTNIITFYTGRRIYLWKGWCVQEDETTK